MADRAPSIRVTAMPTEGNVGIPYRLWRAVLFLLGVVGGGLVGSLVSFLWDLPSSAENTSLLVLLGIAATFAAFGLIPAMLIGMPAVWRLESMGFSRLPATIVLTIGGGTTGALIMLATFGGAGFVRLGSIAGASIGLVFGLLLFPGSGKAAAHA